MELLKLKKIAAFYEDGENICDWDRRCFLHLSFNGKYHMKNMEKK